jgi:hypothetical protein
MKKESCDFGVYNGLSYRICYGLTNQGKMDYSKELYEFHKNCKCGYCDYRFKHARETVNHITVTTDNKTKFPEVEEIIKNWECESKTEQERKYIRL